MEKAETLRKMKKEGLIATIRVEDKENGEKLVEAMIKGGIKFFEITTTVPGAIKIIEYLIKKYTDEDIVIGAGTVLDASTAKMAIEAGVGFVVSPNLDASVVKICNRYKVPILPAIMNVEEAISALELGVDVLKIFPGSTFGPSLIKSFKTPLPQADFMPTSGVSVDNVGEWFKAGAVVVGTGNTFIKDSNIGNYENMMKMAENFVTAVKNAKNMNEVTEINNLNEKVTL